MTHDIQTFSIPGTDALLVYERDLATGQLLRLHCNGTLYLEQVGDRRSLGNGLVTFTEAMLPSGLLRHGQTSGQRWTETYRWDQAGRPIWIDGVEVRRDAQHRVTACLSDQGNWFYAYANDQLVAITSPTGTRHLTYDRQGRLVRVRQGDEVQTLAYDSGGDRIGTPLPPTHWHRDELGRLWVVKDAQGRIQTTYLWNGFACLGRIDGPPGAPLSAAFSLDPSGTPVREIRPDGVTLIRRDAFGENLLRQPGVPGLYGGGVWQDKVYLRSRRLDPLTGCFTAPDPWHGRSTDPRRASGYAGPLTVEAVASGPYTLCQHDPIGRADPTGEISIPLILSDLTWSLQNNLVSWLGMDFWLNFIMSVGLIVPPFVTDWGSRFIDSEGLGSSDRLGSFAVRRDGFVGTFQQGGERAWTFQHIVWANRRLAFEPLTRVRVFVPDTDFRPSLYGSILKVEPSQGQPFLLRGTATPGNIPNETIAGMAIDMRLPNWSRAGGTAEAVVPGSQAPHFPCGGLHFNSIRTDLSGPQAGTLRELEVSDGLGVGTSDTRIVARLAGSSLGFASSEFGLLQDSGTVRQIVAVIAVTEASGQTRLRLDRDIPSLREPVTLRRLGAPQSTETGVNSAAPTILNLVGTTAAYAAGDPLRVTQNTDEAALLIDRLEAQVSLDAALPTSFVQPLTVALAQLSGSVQTATLTAAQSLDFGSVTPPNVGDAIAVAGNTLAVRITANPGGSVRQVDRDLTSLGIGNSITWQRLVRGAELGQRAAAPEAGTSLTYQPQAVRSAPTSGFLWVEDNTANLALRSVVSRTYDGAVLDGNLPGNPANPYQVQRFTFGGTALPVVAIDREVAIALTPPLTLNGESLLIQRIAATTIGAVVTTGTPITGMTLSGSTLSLTVTPATVLPDQPGPAQPVLLISGSNREWGLVRQVMLTVTCDRSLTVRDPAGNPALRIVPLVAGSPLYTAQRRAPLIVAVLPQVGGNRVHMPVFQTGELVEANWTGAARPQQYRITAVEGTTLTLTGDLDLPAAAANLTIQRLSPDFPKITTPLTPRFGSAHEGIRGEPVGTASGGNVTTNQFKFHVWQPNVLAANTNFALVDGDTVFPVRIDSAANRSLELQLATAPGLTGNLEVRIPTVTQSRYATSFTQDSPASLVARDFAGIDALATLPALPTGPELVLVVPFRQATEADRSAAGNLSPGTVRIPQDPENWEVDRHQSLVDHELNHTLQSALWGPLLLAWFPVWAVELIYDVASDVALPEFSAYVSGEILEEGSNRYLQIPDFRGIAFAKDDDVQITNGNRPVTLKLGDRDGQRFRITRSRAELPNGAVNVRRVQNVVDWPLDALLFLTHGGLLNFFVGSTYSGILLGLGKLFYALGRTLFGRGDVFPAAADGRVLRLSTDAGGNAVRTASRVIVQADNGSVVRAVEGVEGNTLTLRSPIPYTGTVQVAPYSTHTPDSAWDWHDYYPATIPDPARPAAIRIDPVNGSSLSLQPLDRVTVTTRNISKRTLVTAVAADGLVELQDTVLFDLGEEREFRIAKVGEDDPMGNADSVLIREAGMDWMRWIFDPYGQLYFRTRPERGSFLDVLGRIGKYLFGTKSWSPLVPGYFWWDNAFNQNGNGHLSMMEQESSQESGDLYSPLGRLRGEVTVVGDIARYWYFLQNREGTTINTNQQDAPGINVQPNLDLRLMPFVTAETGSSNPNRGATAGDAASRPGNAVADAFYRKDNNNPNDVSPGLNNPPRSIAPSDRGWIPTSGLLERCVGMYVAFTRPGDHRITTRDGIGDAVSGRAAQDGGKQTLFYNRTVADVIVEVAGQVVAEDATLTLVQTQRATVITTPNSDRRYSLMLTSPSTGANIRLDGETVIVAQTQNTTTDELVDVARVYRFDTANNHFDAGGLNHHGVHLPTDLLISVRRFAIAVTNTLPIRSAIDLDASHLVTTNRHPGDEVFVLVPTAILAPLTLGTITYPGGTPAATHPNPTITVETVPATLQRFVADGGIFKVSFSPDDPPEETAQLPFSVQVGRGGNSATLTASLTLEPHFRLINASYQVARGASLTLTGEAIGGGAVNAAATVTLLPNGDGITPTVSGTTITLAIAATAPLGSRQVIVTDAANPNRKARRTIQITA
jgi:YD repeat-containing protein